MALAFGMRPGVARVKVRFVDHFEGLRRKRAFKFGLD